MIFPYTHPIAQIIKQRYSCRSYLDVPIEEPTRTLLADFASELHTGPLGAQMRFELVTSQEQDRKALKDLGTYGFIRGAAGFVIGVLQDTEQILEDYGYLMEKIILVATDLGLGTCWLGGTFTKSSFAAKVSARPGEIIPAVVSVGYRAKKPWWFETLIRSRAGAEMRLPWERLFFDSRFGVPLSSQDAGAYAIPLEMVRWGPSASNQQPWRVVKVGHMWHFFLQRTPRYRDNMLARLFTVADLQRVDMGIAMCHFELMAREHGLDGQWEKRSPTIELPDEWTEYTISWVS